MVVDTSALAAIFFREPEREAFRNAIVAANSRLISAATVLEAGMVIEGRKGGGAGREFDLFIIRAQIEIVPIDAELADLARSAWRKYGKGRHPAGLNFGDCFSYALAKATGEPLLAKGTDFAKTDVLVHSP
jgi:ribonuclease VapC